jgi:ATP-binding cassette subfamily B protein RaxB
MALLASPPTLSCVRRAVIVRQARKPFIPLQDEATECGLVCIHAVTELLGQPVHAALLREKYGVSARGLRISEVLEILRREGFESNVVASRGDVLRALSAPVIAIKDSGHFVVVARVGYTRSDVFDPAAGWVEYPNEEVLRLLQSLVIEVSTKVGVGKKRPVVHFNYVHWIKRFLSPVLLAPLVGLGLLEQVAALGIPWLTRDLFAKVDTVEAGVVSLSIVGAYVVTTSFGAFVGFWSAIIRVRINARLGWLLTRDALRRLLDMPANYLFRQTPEMLARKLGMVDLVQQFILWACISGVTQIFTTIVAIWIALGISKILTVLGLGAVAFGGWVEWRFQRRLRFADEASFRAGSEHGVFLADSLRSAQSVRLLGVSSAIVDRVTNLYEEKARFLKEKEQIGALKKSFIDGFGVMDRVAYLVAGSVLVEQGQIAFGDFVSVGLFRELIRNGLMTWISIIRQHQLTRDGLSKIQPFIDHSAGHHDVPSSGTGKVDGSPSVLVRDLCFRYSYFDPLVIHNLNLDIGSGEFVGICAPSGTGKSTLAHLISGLHKPSAGEIRFVSRGSAYPEARAKTRVAYVMQSEALIAGTIRENISFFRNLDAAEIERAAAVACIHSDIMEMAMRYDTRVYEGVSSLSGGQRQRVLIARALVGKPDLLILDEATSYLDEKIARKIISAIRMSETTIIMLSHNQSMLSLTDRVVAL